MIHEGLLVLDDDGINLTDLADAVGSRDGIALAMMFSLFVTWRGVHGLGH